MQAVMGMALRRSSGSPPSRDMRISAGLMVMEGAVLGGAVIGGMGVEAVIGCGSGSVWQLWARRPVGAPGNRQGRR